jgi:hypothetical protein
MNEMILSNPITQNIFDSINSSRNKLNFAVPFLSSFSMSVLNTQNTNNITDKRIIIKFDSSSLSSFDLPTIKKLLDLGFKVRYDNTIHLKLYITDNDTYVTSSNFTKGGFEDNIELSVRIDNENKAYCENIFENIWTNSINEVTYKLIDDNLAIYNILKRRDKFQKNRTKITIQKVSLIGLLDLELIIKDLFLSLKNDPKRNATIIEANKLRNKKKTILKNGFDTSFFYVDENNSNRRNTLFYDFVYGYESKLASTGMREEQFKTVFEHLEFINVLEFIFPEIIGMKPWNLDDEKELQEFCNGIFEFKIPQYVESLPIRLASYFYPSYFLPIFKLSDLEKVCNNLGEKSNAISKGDKLYSYNNILRNHLNILPIDNYIRSTFVYNIFYTIELYEKLINGKDLNTIKSEYRQIWKKEYIENGYIILNNYRLLHPIEKFLTLQVKKS